MKSSNKIALETETVEKNEPAIDPFASDFFGVRTELIEEIEPPKKISKRKKEVKKQKKSEWFAKLPKVTNRQAEFSSKLENLPHNLTEDSAKVIGETIANYTFRASDSVECSVISVSEINLKNAVRQISKSPQIFLSLGCQPGNESALIVLNTVFASTVIDLILGGKGAEIADRRNLSPIEITIIEFLASNMLGEINRYLGEPLFCLQEVGSEPQISFDADEHGGEIVFMIEADGFSGVLTALVPQIFLNSLDRLQNPLLIKKPKPGKLADVEKIVPKIGLNFQVGTTYLDAESLSFLELDDIVLIEEPQINFEGGVFGENLQTFVGKGRNFRLAGSIAEIAPDGELLFEIKDIISEETRRKFLPLNIKMDTNEIELTENENAEAEDPTENSMLEETVSGEQMSASLENLRVGLRVEIAGNKISLRELQNLRVGQIIALGCRPTDDVRVVSDNNEEPIAVGELVEIEGQLGVRLKKIFV